MAKGSPVRDASGRMSSRNGRRSGCRGSCRPSFDGKGASFGSMRFTYSRLRACGVPWLDALNTRHPWSHNDHFHDWILSRLPVCRGRAVDVGCGQGLLVSRLAPHFDSVVGTDLDPRMRAEASQRVAGLSHAIISDAQLDDLEPGLDLVTMVAVLHHLDVESALARVRELLAPGGKLLVVGLARRESTVDVAWDVWCSVTNPLIGLVKHPGVARGAEQEDPFPVRDPEVTLAELRELLGRVMPGAQLRRRIGFRHTIEWTKPSQSVPGRRLTSQTTRKVSALPAIAGRADKVGYMCRARGRGGAEVRRPPASSGAGAPCPAVVGGAPWRPSEPVHTAPWRRA